MSKANNPFPNEEFKAHEFAKANMTKAFFNGVNLTDAKFWAVLVNTLFKDCNMSSSKFDDVNLSGADFNNINLSGSHFNNMNLSNAKFHGINLSGTSFSALDMSNVEINDANIEGMKIDGILVTDLIDAYDKQSG